MLHDESCVIVVPAMLQLLPLANPLLLKAYSAAFAEKNLSTAEASKFNVVEAVDALVGVYENLAPRSVAHVLLGAVKIYGFQVEALRFAVRKELQNAHKQEPFQRPKELHAAATTLATSSATKGQKETPKETLLQLEPVSVEAPRLQAREEDISFEEWRDASVRSSLLSRSSDRILRSERFLQDLGVDQSNLLEVEDLPADIPPPDLDLPAGTEEEKENLAINPVARNPSKAFVRTDPTTQLTKKAVKNNLTTTADIVKMPTFQGPKRKVGSLTGPSSLLCSSLAVLMDSSAYKDLQEPPPFEPIEDEPFPDPPVPVEDENPVEEKAEGSQSPRVSVPASVQESDPTEQDLLSQRSRKMLLFLQEKMRSTKKVSFAALTRDKPKELKASSLFELLQLTQQGYVTLTQRGDFGDIVVRPTNLFAG